MGAHAVQSHNGGCGVGEGRCDPLRWKCTPTMPFAADNVHRKCYDLAEGLKRTTILLGIYEDTSSQSLLITQSIDFFISVLLLLCFFCSICSKAAYFRFQHIYSKKTIRTWHSITSMPLQRLRLFVCQLCVRHRPAQSSTSPMPVRPGALNLFSAPRQSDSAQLYNRACCRCAVFACQRRPPPAPAHRLRECVLALAVAPTG